ncbi:unnamed protein product [Rotaria magnacalcarata]|uniref:G-protein coupled receptors family 1 profile domain-containing protein n=1 Tax=Rotaria magnacalcarata TaxID=392030 RepID=A0A816RK13_9BILA|nr:unnamed protein product [Rotaria magnacalcarata]CAF4062447.1 unnamed protein product [Rotaria magnacalcarata]
MLSLSLLPFLLLFGNINCLLSIIVFLQKSMRKNPIGLYFLSSTICNMIFINTMITGTILYFGFHIDPTGNILILCQIQFYIAFVTSILSSSFLVLASIYRFIISSSYYSMHRFSSHSMAIKFVLSVTTFWCIIHIHLFIFVIKSNEANSVFYCVFQAGTYELLIILYEFIINDVLTPALIILFSLQTILNVRHVMVNPISRLHSIDRQLVNIMLSQCFTFVSFRLPFLIYLIFDHIIKASVEKLSYGKINIVLFYLSLLCIYIPYCSFFFVNLISYSFRAEFIRLTKRFIHRSLRQIRKRKRHRHNQVFPLDIMQRRAPNRNSFAIE